jgi:hypothetical protein
MDKVVRLNFLQYVDHYLSVLRRPHTRDYRTRRDRTERRTQAFAAQLPALKDVYMAWMHGLGKDGLSRVYSLPPDAEVQGQTIIHEVDIFRKPFFYIFIPIKNSLYF